MEAIILAGGLGTRLREAVQDLPKPLAPVNGKPFLEYILDNLCEQGIEKVILAVNYKREQIQTYFKNNYKGMAIEYSIEEEPLFTGGAIKKALSYCKEENVFVLNGDTYFEIDLSKMYQFHCSKQADLTIAKKMMCDCARYGTIECQDDRILEFHEKYKKSRGYINGGLYLMKKTLLDGIEKKKFSFEKEVLQDYMQNFNLYAYESVGYFIDIGIPEDYWKAQNDFLGLLSGK
ncbi:nucleotidyltransferase family protein [Anaerosinus massiliensis]|uniref:nucleotidyltransferase family protein n=1 Tax=Massilibacillus massiliensis TaxID=1806837 RepID=UPI000AF39AF1|nr:nucleotidyltransferase family protein [Massilibacillus massiliensis]